jgi:hypothetical protein
VLWAITLMESGSLKTPVYNAAVAPLIAAQRLYEESHQKNVEGFKEAKARHEADTSLWRPPPRGGRWHSEATRATGAPPRRSVHI